MKVLDFDLAAARPKFSGKDFGESACTVASAGSLAYCELLFPMSIELGSSAVPVLGSVVIHLVGGQHVASFLEASASSWSPRTP
ncbi:hypothetical protein [Streptomyces sp. WAC00263]|uniref:hypothetical protein n=1 Tax=Streptomyces sp. WAC00263 TaxID=1917422 RepID=UPI0015EF78F0|nr:hypothetical protein [Streptomyces sp. WAC00263]